MTLSVALQVVTQSSFRLLSHQHSSKVWTAVNMRLVNRSR